MSVSPQEPMTAPSGSVPSTSASFMNGVIEVWLVVQIQVASAGSDTREVVVVDSSNW